MHLSAPRFSLIACASGAIAVLVFTTATTAFAKPDEIDPRHSLGLAIREGIALLKAKKYVAFVEKFAPPDILRRLDWAGELDRCLKQFAEGEGDRLLQIFEHVKGRSPVLDNSGKRATFTLIKPVAGHASVSFVRIGKQWYLSN